MKTIPYGRQNITDDDVKAVVETLKSDFLTQGPKIQEFEEAFAAYVGSKYAVAVANGTAALHLCAISMGVNVKTNVITSPITFAASANCIRYCGGNVYFADIDAETFLLDFDKVKKLIESKPKGFFSGIIPVDFAGFPVDLEAYRKLADEHGLWIIEDACHAPGGYFIDSKNTKAFCGSGIYADLAIFSFHPVKHIATGEGGMITTNNTKLYDKLKLLRTHGIIKDPSSMQENHGGWYYEMIDLGYNYRLPDMLASLGISQLNRAEEGLQRRQQIAKKYDEAFSSTSIYGSKYNGNGRHAYHLYIIQSENRSKLYAHLRDNNILAQVHYIPVHLMPYYKKFGWQKGDFPVAESYYEKCLSLPMYPALSDDELDYVVKKVKEVG